MLFFSLVGGLLPVRALANNSQNEALALEATPPAFLLGLSVVVATHPAESNVSDNALVAMMGPVGVVDETSSFVPSASESGAMSVYVVRSGDTISEIAEMFEVSSNTIRWANDLKKNDPIHEGDILLILPVSGVKHVVKSGDTLGSLAKKYKVEEREIAEFNSLAAGTTLHLGEELIIPDGVLESSQPIADLNASIARDNQYYQRNPIRTISGYFINPVPGARKSQGIHDRNGVDLAIPTGTPIRASASGRVSFARLGYNGGFGNMAIIKHPNGVETLYAHMSRLATHGGTEVSQGDIIGYVGSTGRSTGPHLHFEVHGARNPGADGSWASY